MSKGDETREAILDAAEQAAAAAFANHRVHRDLGGHPRVLEAWS